MALAATLDKHVENGAETTVDGMYIALFNNLGNVH
jgi:hypothetical protein